MYFCTGSSLVSDTGTLCVFLYWFKPNPNNPVVILHFAILTSSIDSADRGHSIIRVSSNLIFDSGYWYPVYFCTGSNLVFDTGGGTYTLCVFLYWFKPSI